MITLLSLITVPSIQLRSFQQQTSFATIFTTSSPITFTFAALSKSIPQNYNSANDIVLTLKHHLGRIKSSYQSEAYEQSLELMKDAEKIFKNWKLHVQSKIKERDSPELVTENGEVVIPEPCEFNIKVTHIPKTRKCVRQTTEGSSMKIHFVGKLLKDGKKGKAFDSTFHTGSMPYKFILGQNGAKVEGWNKGLIGMCEGERRTLTIPYTMGYGEKGIPGKVPPYANLKYMVELVEFSGASKRPSDTKKDL